MLTDFEKLVFAVVKKIPFGETRSYKQVAEAVGRPGAWRAVGNALNKNKNYEVVPCYRVVRSNGEAGGFKWGAGKKRKLLEKERKRGNSRESRS